MAEIKRKLAAIVFTDIVGFTKLSAENEPVALELLNRQREILKPKDVYMLVMEIYIMPTTHF